MYIVKIRFPEAIDIQIQESTATVNAIGEPIQNWIDIRTIKGEIQPLKIKSSRDLQGITETSTDRLFTSDIVKSNQRLITADAIYNVQTVQDWRTHKEAILELITL